MLSIGLPLHREYPGRSWPDWRDDDESYLRSWLSHPTEGILGAVEKLGFWYPGWGLRPTAVPAALALAEEKLIEVGQLVPLRGYRYLPSLPALPGNPVFSIWETDVVYAGADLLAFLSHRNSGPQPCEADRHRIPFWSWLAEGGAPEP